MSASSDTRVHVRDLEYHIILSLTLFLSFLLLLQLDGFPAISLSLVNLPKCPPYDPDCGPWGPISSKPTDPSVIYYDVHTGDYHWTTPFGDIQFHDFRLPVTGSVSNIHGAQLVELRGWILDNLSQARVNIENPDHPDDWGINLELDPQWLDQKGIDINKLIHVGNLFLNSTIAEPKVFETHENDPKNPNFTQQFGVSRPIVHVELMSWRPGQTVPQWPPWPKTTRDVEEPKNWNWIDPTDPNPNVRWPWNPRCPSDHPSSSCNPSDKHDLIALKEGDYVRMVGALVLDDPHHRTYDPHYRGVYYNDASNPARWTEMHPPDLIQKVNPPAERKEVVQCAALFAPYAREVKFDVPGVYDQQRYFFDNIQPDPYATVGYTELIDNENTDTGQIIQKNIKTSSDHINVDLKLDAGGKFKACYRVFWKMPTLHKTTISLDPMPTNVPWGQHISLTGKLIDSNTSAGIAGKYITFSGDGLYNPTALQANTQGDGSFSIRGISSDNVANGLKIQAHFNGDFTQYRPSESNTVTYNTIKHKVELKVLAKDVPWGMPTSFATTFKDLEDEPTIPSGQSIHFTGTGVIGVQDVVTTNGEAVGIGSAPNDIGSGWTVKAQFLGDDLFMPAESDAAMYNTTKHNTRLVVSASDVPWGKPTGFTTFLTDIDNRTAGITGKAIHFNGTGVIGVSDQITDSKGKAVGKGTAPMNVSNGLTVKANFAGDNMYVGTSAIALYKTLKHQTVLFLAVTPDTQDPGKNYAIRGRLMDTTMPHPLDSKKVTFKATSPIVLPATLTNTNGFYVLSNLVAPGNPGVYDIQSRFLGDESYIATESPTEFLTVR